MRAHGARYGCSRKETAQRHPSTGRREPSVVERCRACERKRTPQVACGDSKLASLSTSSDSVADSPDGSPSTPDANVTPVVRAAAATRIFLSQCREVTRAARTRARAFSHARSIASVSPATRTDVRFSERRMCLDMRAERTLGAVDRRTAARRADAKAAAVPRETLGACW